MRRSLKKSSEVPWKRLLRFSKASRVYVLKVFQGFIKGLSSVCERSSKLLWKVIWKSIEYLSRFFERSSTGLQHSSYCLRTADLWPSSHLMFKDHKSIVFQKFWWEMRAKSGLYINNRINYIVTAGVFIIKKLYWKYLMMFLTQD